MTFHLDTKAGLGIAAVALLSAAGVRPADAANINDLADRYFGQAHSTTDAANEDEFTSFRVENTSANGKFSGAFVGVNINGKVTATGKVTFSGNGLAPSLEGAPNGNPTGTAQIKKGKAQLSADGRYLVGSFTVIATGDLTERNGKYIFSMDSLINPARASRGVSASAGPQDLAAAYEGAVLYATQVVTEDLLFCGRRTR